MAQPVHHHDLHFGVAGDFLVDATGDLADTRSGDRRLQGTGIRQMIAHRVLCERDGWRLHPLLCAGLDEFIGKPVTPELTEKIAARVRQALTADGAFDRHNIIARAIDLGIGTVAIAIYYRGVGFEKNNKPILTVAYDLQRGSVAQVY